MRLSNEPACSAQWAADFLSIVQPCVASNRYLLIPTFGVVCFAIDHLVFAMLQLAVYLRMRTDLCSRPLQQHQQASSLPHVSGSS